MNDENIPERRSARLLIRNPNDRSLLFLAVNDPNISARVGADKTCWITPGGGVEPGETFEETARRELWEETGLVDGTDAIIGPFLRERRIVLPFGTGENAQMLLSIERYFTVELLIDPNAVTDAHLLPFERGFIHRYHWWTVDAMRAAHEAGTDRFIPEEWEEYIS